MRRCCIRYTQWILRFAGIYTNHSPREKSKTGKKSVRSISRPTCYIYQILPPSSDLSLNHALRCSTRSSSRRRWNEIGNYGERFSSKESVKTPIKSHARSIKSPQAGNGSFLLDSGRERNRPTIFIRVDIHVILRWLAANRRVHWPRYNTLVLLHEAASTPHRSAGGSIF